MPDLRSRFDVVVVCHRFDWILFLLLHVWAKENIIFSLRTQVSIENASPMLLSFKGHGDVMLACLLTRRDTSIPHSRVRSIKSDTQTDMLLGEPKSAICVQRAGCVLHRYVSQEIHRQKLSLIFLSFFLIHFMHDT